MSDVLLVTGGSRGIGAATAICAAKKGWDVAINYARDAEAAKKVSNEVNAFGRRVHLNIRVVRGPLVRSFRKQKIRYQSML